MMSEYRSKIGLSLALAASLVCSAASVRADERRVIQVFIFAGQSNMAGADSEVADPPGFEQTEADHQTRFTTAPLPGGDNSDLYVPWGDIHGHQIKNKLVHGPEVGFARALYQAGWRDVAIIKVFANFGCDAQTWPWSENGTLYEAWMKFVDARIKELTANGDTVQVRGFVWHQGIDDAIHGKLALEYDKNLSGLIASLRKRFHAEDAPFVLARSVNSKIAQPTPDPEGKSPMSIVRKLQVKVGDSVSKAGWIDVDDLPNVNRHHFSADSQLIIGQRYGETFLKIQPRVPK